MKTERTSLGEQETALDEQLSSVSVAEDGNLLLGTKTGDIIRFDRSTRNTRPIELKGSRIYKLIDRVASQGDTLYYVGMRNAGLQRWRVNGRPVAIDTAWIDYKIHRYSPYDFIRVDSTLYVATSNGFYAWLLSDTVTKMKLVYPDRGVLEARGSEFAVRNVQLSPDSTKIFCATVTGVVEYDISTGSITPKGPARPVDHVFWRSDTLFAVSQGGLIVMPADGAEQRLDFTHDPKVYYRDPAGNHWLIASERLHIGRTLDPASTDRFARVVPRNKIPTEGPNLAWADTVNGFTYLIARNALWQIPRNLNVYQNQYAITAACASDESFYFVSDKNWLYRKKIEGGQSVAHRICRIDLPNRVQWVAVNGNELYLTTALAAYRMPVPKTRLGLSRKPTEVELGGPVRMLTAACLARLPESDEPVWFIGTRDSIYCRHRERMEPVQLPLPSKLGARPFVTAIRQDPASLSVYVVTLNHGLYRSDYQEENRSFGDFRTVTDFADTEFAGDFASQGGIFGHRFLLTDHALSGAQGQRLEPAKGSTRLIYPNPDQLFSLSQFGFSRYDVLPDGQLAPTGSFFKDVEFFPEASFAVNDSTLLLSSALGTMFWDTGTGRAAWVDFKDYRLSDLWFWISFMLGCLILVGYFAYRLRKSIRKEAEAKLSGRLENIRERIAELEQLTVPLEAIESEIRIDLKALSDKANLPKNYTVEDAQRLNRLLGELNHRVLGSIKRTLFDQVLQLHRIHTAESLRLAHQTQRVDGRHNIGEAVRTIGRNTRWTEAYERLAESVGRDRERYGDSYEVEGLNRGLVCRLEALEASLRTKELQECREIYGGLREEMLRMESEEAQGRLTVHLNRLSGGLEADPADCCRLLAGKIAAVSQRPEPVWEKLRLLSRLEGDLTLCRALAGIRSACVEYIALVEGEKQYSNRLEPLGKEIRAGIDRFYRSLSAADRELIFEVFRIKLSPVFESWSRREGVLALLLADASIRPRYYCDLLNVERGNHKMDPEKSRIIRAVTDYLQGHDPDSAHYLAQLLFALSRVKLSN